MKSASQPQIDFIRQLKAKLGLDASDDSVMELSEQNAHLEIDNLLFLIKQRG